MEWVAAWVECISGFDYTTFHANPLKVLLRKRLQEIGVSFFALITFPAYTVSQKEPPKKRKIMKHAFLITLSLTTHHIIAMDQPSPFAKATADTPAKVIPVQTNNNNAAFDEMIANIDSAINKQYRLTTFLAYMSDPNKTHNDYFNIIAIARQYYPNITLSKKLLDMLYAKNTFFAQAIEHFAFLAQQNLTNVTPVTLNTVNNYNAPQPILSFNGIDPSIKEYILLRASNQTRCEYTMEFQSEAQVIDFDICPATDTVAISTGGNKSPCRLRLWDLKTATRSHTFDEDNPVQFICFNAPGNQLATLVATAGKVKIKIWDTISKQSLHTIEPDPERIPRSLVYNDHPTNYLLHSCHYLKECPNVWQINTELWLTHNAQLISLGVSKLQPTATASGSKAIVVKENYLGIHPQCHPMDEILAYANLKIPALSVTKNNCHDLYLCQQAISKARTKKSLDLITPSDPFKTATVYEQNMIKESLKVKRNLLIS